MLFVIIILSVLSLVTLFLAKEDFIERALNLAEWDWDLPESSGSFVLPFNQTIETNRSEKKTSDGSGMIEDTTIKQQKCRIPTLNPYDPDILPYLKAPRLQDCKNKKYGVVEDDVLRIKVKDVVAVYLFYIKRIDDFRIDLSEKHTLFTADEDNSGKSESVGPS